ncbi:MAG TPA: pyridoxamine 5'-phosphate oxidase family protein [Candidatus Saccharimonadales bacterium]|nr:pyridoxamine 5'-phosphate oxidase family protein [Candidatus Saccharimonadales bacterium]
MKDYRASAQAILADNIYGTIATTSKDGLPWAAPQFIAFDNDLKNIYWCAARTSQHGQNIQANSKAFIVVYDSSVGPGEGSGVYLQADAAIVTDPDEMKRAMTQLIDRHQSIPYFTLEDVQRPDATTVVFKAHIRQAWINSGREENGQFVLYREPVKL